ncbi:MAG: KH domain-containing protein [bacterium]|nr:KH domain-containing protein [bacterium]
MAEETYGDQELLEYIVKALVDHPEDVKIERKVDEMGVLLILRVHADDMGQLIGKEGSTARAIRTLIRIQGLKNHARVNLKIEEPEGGRRVREVEETPAAPATEEKKDSLDGLDL